MTGILPTGQKMGLSEASSPLPLPPLCYRFFPTFLYFPLSLMLRVIPLAACYRDDYQKTGLGESAN